MITQLAISGRERLILILFCLAVAICVIYDTGSTGMTPGARSGTVVEPWWHPENGRGHIAVDFNKYQSFRHKTVTNNTRGKPLFKKLNSNHPANNNTIASSIFAQQLAPRSYTRKRLPEKSLHLCGQLSGNNSTLWASVSSLPRSIAVSRKIILWELLRALKNAKLIRQVAPRHLLDDFLKNLL